MIAPALRRAALAAALVTAVVSAALVPKEEAPSPKRATGPQSSKSEFPARRAGARDTEIPTILNYKRESVAGIEVVDVFEPRPVPGAVVVAPKPEPPKLPFTYMGRIEESGRLKVVLAQGDLMHLVAKGDRFGGSYQLEEVGPTELVLTYLPLGVRQSLPTGDVK